MRDADRIREQPERSQSWATVVATLAAVVGVCGVFAMGYSIGRRVERLVPRPAPSARSADQVADRLDMEHQTLRELTFYDSLMDDARVPAAAARPAVAAEPVLARPVAPARVAASAAPAPAPKPVATPLTKGAYTLQVSSVRHREEAQALAAAMTRQGLHPYITSTTIPTRGTFYRVRMGRYATAKAADAAKANLKQADIPAWVLRAD